MCKQREDQLPTWVTLIGMIIFSGIIYIIIWMLFKMFADTTVFDGFGY